MFQAKLRIFLLACVGISLCFSPALGASLNEEATAALKAALPNHVTIQHATVKQLAAAVFKAVQKKDIPLDLAEEIVRVAVMAPAVSEGGAADPASVIMIVKAALEANPGLYAHLNRKLMKSLKYASEHPELPAIAEGNADQIAPIIFTRSASGLDFPIGFAGGSAGAPDFFLSAGGGSSSGNVGIVNSPETASTNH